MSAKADAIDQAETSVLLRRTFASIMADLDELRTAIVSVSLEAPAARPRVPSLTRRIEEVMHRGRSFQTALLLLPGTREGTT